MAKNTDTTGNKLNLMKNAMERFSNALNYDFPSVKRYYAISLFEATKLDRNTVGDWDILLDEYWSIWETSKSNQNDEFLELVCATLWRLFLQPIHEKDLNETTVQIDKRFSKAFFQCLHTKQKSMVKGSLEKCRKRNVLMNQRRNLFLANSKLNVKKLELSVETMKRLIEEAKTWDIDIEKKWWFFSEYFSIHELLKFCKNNNILNPLDSREKKFLFCENPELLGIFLEGNPETSSILKDIQVEDEYMSAILKLTNENEESVLHRLHKDFAPVILEILLDKGFSLEERTRKGETPLHCAVTNKYAEVVNLLISQKCNINSTDDDRGYTPLHYAVDIGNLVITNILINAGCHLEIQDKWQGTPLHVAFQQGTSRVIKIMESEDLGKSLAAYITSPRKTEADCGEKEKTIGPIVIALCDAKANINAADDKGYRPLHFASGLGYINIVNKLLYMKCDINATDNKGSTPLHHACKQSLKNVTMALLKAGCEKNARDETGSTAFIVAVRKNATEVVKEMLKDKHCPIERRDKEGKTAFHHAAYNGDIEIVTQLINHKCDKNKKDKIQGRTPLHCAVAAGKSRMVEHLLENGCNPEAQDKNGSTPLHTAVRATKLETITILLKRGCNKEAKDKIGQTPLHRCVELNKQQHIYELLKKCNKDTTSLDGSTPLHTAVKASNTAMVKILVGAGCNKMIKDKNGSIPYDYATIDEIKDILK